ncbi:GTP pyrophosphokinase/guanosine-3',5'-bis(diphosphate) 3'-pyrophosphohydrolase [Nonomuraea solani]|uniref:GTP pyrophosphokinase/guanosine-3',5'-bis(Diphosphate) 3'-pyrophosphohydrolase n=1 Tax=Nonomuraea solani TaxID=1144553 RepID=A0A1H6EDJ0_9ACTN|nr:HD domain-containing protein [Nonomuraea solani]SEG95870.1 GTP pyrophosphokinase/guanosine-3',5'-bis(diphosphate) 3'-pyrophosphohydrolase [Nonomuraea solani]
MIRTFTAKDGWPALRAQWTDRLPDADLAGLDEATAFATRWHGDQTRPAGEPYLEHLLEATRVLVEAVEVTDVDVLRAAVLHDVVEDTACTLDEIRERFGDRVATLVDWVTKPPRPVGWSREEARTAYLDRLRGAPYDAILVKLADRLSNVQRLDTHPRPEKRRGYYDETVRSILPFAERHPWFHDWYDAWRTEFRHVSEPE